MKQSANKKRILRTVVLTLVALLFGLGVYTWNAENLTGNKMPMPFGFGASVVLTGSMESRLSADDLVIIKKTDDYKVDDIVVFQENGSLIIHRIIEVNGEEIITKGDANNMADSPINVKDIKGELIFDIPYVGVIIKFIKQPIVVILLLLAAVLLAERSFRKEKEQNTDEIKAILEEIKKLKEN